MKWFMFGVTVLFAILAIGSVIFAIGAFVAAWMIAGIIDLICAAAFTVMSTSVAKSLREV